MDGLILVLSAIRWCLCYRRSGTCAVCNMLDFCLWQDADTRAVGGMLDFCLLQYADTYAVGNLMFVLSAV